MRFFPDYNKPGPGVEKDEPPKKAWMRFLELYWRKFSRFAVFNLLSFLFLLPIITVLFYAVGVLILQGADEAVLEEGGIFFSRLQILLIGAAVSLPSAVSVLLLIVSVVFYGPMMCAKTYIYRNYSQEKHAWMSDYWEQMKKNFRQGAALGLIELAVVSLLIFNMFIQPSEETVIAFLPVVRFGSAFMLILVFFARRYTFAMSVTFNLPLSTILKNGIAFAFIGLWRNLGLAAFDAALIVLILFVPFFDVFFLPFFFFSLTGFLSVSAAFPLIKKHMIKSAEEEESSQTHENTDE
jgi:uncharacterized membrane protein YesL